MWRRGAPVRARVRRAGHRHGRARVLYGVLPRPDARLLPQVLSPHPACMLRFRALFFPLRFSRSSFPHPTPCFGRCAPVLAFRPASASHFDPRTPARTPVLHSGPVFREGRLLRFEPALRSSHPVLALLSPYSCLRTPASALLPPHPGPHSGPVFRAVHSGLALRPRPAPTFCPALWVADLKGGFWKEAFAFRAQAPVPAFWPCVPALTTRSSRPGSCIPAPHSGRRF